MKETLDLVSEIKINVITILIYIYVCMYVYVCMYLEKEMRMEMKCRAVPFSTLLKTEFDFCNLI